MARTVLRDVDRALVRALSGPGAEFSFEADLGRLSRQVFLTILRRRATLDWLVDRHRRGPVRGPVRRLLWWALAETLYLDGLPLPVVVHTAVEEAKAHGPGVGGFVNALLRAVLAPGREAVLAAVSASAPPWVRLDLGRGLYEAWSRRMSAEALSALAALLQEPAPMVVRLRAGHVAAVVEGLVPAPSVPWAPGTRLFRCGDAAAFFGSEAWRGGAFYVQDPSTLLAPALLGVRAGETVGDLCCAPGGKALLLLEQAADTRLVCMDRSLKRLGRLRENVAGCGRCELLAGDVTHAPLRAGCLDAILLDVPCSNTGVVRRRPDVRWHFTRAGVSDLARLQAEMLAAAAALLRPGGRLAYSTCSIEPEENGEQVRRFVAAQPTFRLLREEALEPCAAHDGAYAAVLRKQGEDPSA
ncbi:MAG: RsmB/NOP family class I SAM-dependent RNA methyltransferase [Lentisphaeria bacterium]|nr:RsmB/NOP family class I SAM-dependent RNA methyltransferase [Lentisphaeria bacterium]